MAGSKFKVVLRRSYNTKRHVELEILIFVSLNDGLLSLNCFKNIAALRENVVRINLALNFRVFICIVLCFLVLNI